MCSGCWSDDISCAIVSVFTNATRESAETVTDRGDTPFDVIVIVAPVDGAGVGVGVGVGELGVERLFPPPQDNAVSTSAVAQQRERPVLVRVRRTPLTPAVHATGRRISAELLESRFRWSQRAHHRDCKVHRQPVQPGVNAPHLARDDEVERSEGEG